MDIWDRVKLLMKGTELSYQERECRLYNLFDKFAYVQGETLYEYYWRFSYLINDMHTIGMTMQQVQVNTKFLNALLLEWSKFVTDVKLAKSLYTTNYDQFLVVSMFQQGEDPIECINKAMAFLSIVASRFPPSNNQLRTLSNPRNQATIKDTEDLDAYDLDCIDLSSTKAQLMANLSSCDSEVLSEVPYSDSYLNDMINQDMQEMHFVQQEIDTLKETLSNHVKEKESLSKTLTVFKTESKEKESKYIDKEIVLEKQNKELENIICKMYRSTQAMHMLTKPQVFYDDTHKQALGYQNPFHLKKAQRIQPTLYDGSVIAKEHAMIYVIDDEETLILEEESRSKMLDKQNDPISIEKKIKISPIDYSKLNKIKEDFGKRFVTQKELSAEQAFWLKHLSFSKTPVTSHTPVRIEAPSELPKVSLVNESLKKLKYQLDNFDNVVKKRTTSDAITAAQSQEKDTVIIKFKDRIKSLIGKDSLENVKKHIDEIETINIELKHSVAKLLSKNENLRKEREHLKLIYKDQFDSIRKTRAQSKEHCDSLIAQINAKSVENSDLNAQLQEKVFAITALKNESRKLKGKNVVDTAISKPNATIASGMFKLDIEPISHRLQNNKDTHEVYIEKTIENSETLRRFVERARTHNPMPPKETTIAPVVTPTSGILVYSKRLKAIRSIGSSNKVKIVESKTSNSKEPKQSWGSTISDVSSSSLNDCRFRNDHVAKIMGYEDYQMGNIIISQVYYVEGLDGVDLLKGSRGSNLYTLSMDNLLLSSPICLLSKASKTKSWLWHRRLSHLNFDYITSLAKHGLVRGLPKLKYQKDHLCSACALGKSKKHSHKPKAEDSIQEKLYLLHMDLCGPMRVQSINGRKYILVIVDDFSRFTWVKFLRSKDEVPEFVIKFLKMIQVRLNATVRNIRTDNGTEFVNQTLRDYYEEVRISHQTSVARTPQQNGVVKR
ncbi:retrovirus-related pol polyprotein from transposon TNT 1-94 [Tanacetum coccineum]